MANPASLLSRLPYEQDANLTTTKIAIVGSINMDFINFIDIHPAPGGHVQANEVIQAPGGHGANQAVACARLSGIPWAFLTHEDYGSNIPTHQQPGIDVSMIGVVGAKDGFADTIKDKLQENRVNTNHVSTIQGENSGRAYINVNCNGESTVIFTLGASTKFLPGPLFDPKFIPDFVLVQLEIPMEMVHHALDWAKKHNAMTICNAAPATPSVGDKIYEVDHLIVNEVQADILNGLQEKPFDDRINQRDKIRQHYQDLCERFHDNGAVCVIITMAELGVVGSRRDPLSLIRQQYVFDAEQGENKQIVDTTGASDAFIGGYTVGLVHQKHAGFRQDMASAMRLGIKAAGLCISRPGSMDAIPTPEEIMNTTFRSAGA
ncbi:putative ribokinase [Ascochyta clinopodiicola]|nr:putative ribokinase [Ascochyta clinopodiicola]